MHFDETYSSLLCLSIGVKMKESTQGQTEFWDLYQRHSTQIYNYMLWFLGNRDDAEDLTSTVFLQARERFHSLRNPNKARQWLWTIARNSARNFLRDRKETVRLEHYPELQAPFSENGHRIVRLKTALRELAGPDREIIILREYHGFSYAEMAELLETSIPSIKSRLFRARENLRRQYFQPEQ